MQVNNCKNNYAYSDGQEKLIQSEFTRLKDQCYLDHAGATLYSEKQLFDVLSDLNSGLYANPHAQSTSGKATEDLVDQIRFEILRSFKTDVNEYSVVFTSSATAALKLVAETFDYRNGNFTYLQDNHTSVLGMREYAPNIKPIRLDEAISAFNSNLGPKPHKCNSLFVFPAQSNFSGTKYPLSWIEKSQNGALNDSVDVPSNKWFCLLDAASFVSTNELDLSAHKPDFVCVSFYKIFGYPMGLGALVVKNSSSYVLRKKYYGGGTVFMALSLKNVAVPRKILHERFEDGTLSFLSILALRHGFETLKRLGLDMDVISEHTFLLAQYVFESLSRLCHGNGGAVAELYHDNKFTDRRCQGGIVNFNLLRSNGEYIGYSEVLHMANLYNIHLRTGCFCNPGACQMHLRLTTDDVETQFDKGHVCGDQNDLIDGRPTGSVRISFGYMSEKRDADRLLQMIKTCFVETSTLKKSSNLNDHSNKFSTFNPTSNNNVNSKPVSGILNQISKPVSGILNQIYVYPIKSCAPFPVEKSWELSPIGLKYDREWMIVNESGVCLTQKRNTSLCLIKPRINLIHDVLELSFEGEPSVTVPLTTSGEHVNISPCRSKVCNDYVQGSDCGDVVANWLSDVLNHRGLRLIRQNSDDGTRKTKKGSTMKLSLANQAQFLLVNRASAQWLFDVIDRNLFDDDVDDFIRRFRPNFVVDFEKPLIENELERVVIGDKLFESDGKCTRCQMICIDQNTGQVSAEPLRALSNKFGNKLTFGIYLRHKVESKNEMIAINSACIGESGGGGD